MAKKLGFKDFLTVDYAPGMPDLIKKRAKKRKMDSGGGTNAEYSSTHSPEENIDTVDEALSLAQRRARSRKMKMKQRQIQFGRKRALARAASPEKLKKRAEKAARNAVFRKLSKGKSRDELPPQRRAEIEKRIAKMGSRIKRLATKLLPQVRKIDKERRKTKQEEK